MKLSIFQYYFSQNLTMLHGVMPLINTAALTKGLFTRLRTGVIVNVVNDFN